MFTLKSNPSIQTTISKNLNLYNVVERPTGTTSLIAVINNSVDIIGGLGSYSWKCAMNDLATTTHTMSRVSQ